MVNMGYAESMSPLLYGERAVHARNTAVSFSMASFSRVASYSTSVAFFSMVIASVSAGRVVAPYPVNKA